MARTPRMMRVTLGPDVPLVPYAHFSKLPGSIVREAWQVVGPSVERNLTKRHALWTIFAACYLEGLAHGAGIAREDSAQGIVTEGRDAVGGSGERSELEPGPAKQDAPRPSFETDSGEG